MNIGVPATQRSVEDLTSYLPAMRRIQRELQSMLR